MTLCAPSWFFWFFAAINPSMLHVFNGTFSLPKYPSTFIYVNIPWPEPEPGLGRFVSSAIACPSSVPVSFAAYKVGLSWSASMQEDGGGRGKEEEWLVLLQLPCTPTMIIMYTYLTCDNLILRLWCMAKTCTHLPLLYMFYWSFGGHFTDITTQGPQQSLLLLLFHLPLSASSSSPAVCPPDL